MYPAFPRRIVDFRSTLALTFAMFAYLSPGFTNLMTTPAARAGRFGHILLWVFASSLLVAAAVLLDAPMAHVVNIHSNPFLQNFAHFVSHLGEGWVVAVVGVLCSAFLLLVRRTQAARIVFLVAAIGLITGATATVLRSIIGRTRPNAHTAQGVYGIRHDSHWIIGKSEFGSFPSGHAATVAGLAAAAWMFNRRFGLVASGYAALVSWSRLAQGVHHFSDIVAACILGVVGAHIIVTRARPLIKGLEQAVQEAWLGGRPGVSTIGSDASTQV